MKKLLILSLVASKLLSSNSLNIEQLLKELYGSVSGFGIQTSEREMIIHCGGDPTYGEITYEGVQALIKEFAPTKQDVFYDLGSGVGKMVVQIYLETPVKKSIGIELSPTRNQEAQKIIKKIQGRDLIHPKRKLMFQFKNMLDLPLTDATLIFTNSLCFPNKLMEDLLKKILTLKPGLRVASTKEFPKHNRFKLEKIIKVPMSWSPKSSIYLYKLEK